MTVLPDVSTPRSHLVLLLSYTAGPPALAMSAVSPFARVAVETCTLAGFVAPGLQLQCVVRRDRRVAADPTECSSSSSSEDDEDEDNHHNINDEAGVVHRRRVRKTRRTGQVSPSAAGAYMFAWSYLRRQASCPRGVHAGGLAAPPTLTLVPGLLGREGSPGEGVVSRRLPHAQVIHAHLEWHHTAAEARTGLYSVNGRLPPVSSSFSTSQSWRRASASSLRLFDGAEDGLVDGNEAAAGVPLRVMYLSASTERPEAIGDALLAALWWLARPLLASSSSPSSSASASSSTDRAADIQTSTILPLVVLIESDDNHLAETMPSRRQGETVIPLSEHAPPPSPQHQHNHTQGDMAMASPLGALLFPVSTTVVDYEEEEEEKEEEKEATLLPVRAPCCPHSPPCAQLLGSLRASLRSTSTSPKPDTKDEARACDGLCRFRRVVRVAACDFTKTPPSLALALLTALTHFTHVASSSLSSSSTSRVGRRHGQPDSTARRLSPFAVEELRLRATRGAAWLMTAASAPRLVTPGAGGVLSLSGGWGPTVLSHLRVLDVSHCVGVTTLSWLAHSVGATTNEKGRAGGVKIAAAPCLQVLDVSFCESITDLSPLACMPDLRILRASRLPGLASLSWLLDSATAVAEAARMSAGGGGGGGGLSSAGHALGGGLALEELVLTDCGLLVDLYPIGVLRRLRRLALGTAFDVSPAQILPEDSLDAPPDERLLHGGGGEDTTSSAWARDFRPLPRPVDAASIASLSCEEDDLSWIQHCGALVTLSLRRRAHLRYVGAIATLAELEVLDLTNCAYVRRLAWLAACTRLTTVKLSGCVRITDWGALHDLPLLDSVGLGSGGHVAREEATRAQRSADAAQRGRSTSPSARENRATPTARIESPTHRLAWISRTTRARQLRTVSLDYLEEGLGNLAVDQALRRLTGLRTLDLRSCAQVQTLTWAFQLPHLRELVLFDCTGIRDLSALGGLAGLERLFLSDTATVRSMLWVSECHRLREAYLVNATALEDMRSFALLPHLQTLALTHSAVEDLSWLLLPPSTAPSPYFPSLLDLDLSYTAQLKDAQPLGVIHSLRRLRLVCCTALLTLGPTLPLAQRPSLPSLSSSSSSPSSSRTMPAHSSGDARFPPTSRRQRARAWFSAVHALWPSAFAQPRSSAAPVHTAALKASATTPVAAVGLGGCLALEDLDVARCRLLSDLSPVARLPQLRRLCADHTGVKSLHWLPLCTTLTHLILTGTPLMTRGRALAGPQISIVDPLSPGFLLRHELVPASSGAEDAKASDAFIAALVPPDLTWWNGVSLRQL